MPTTVIDGQQYKLELWITSEAFAWQARLAEVGLESVAMALSDSKRAWATLREADMPAIARTILEKVDAADLPKFIEKLLAGVYIVLDGGKGTVEKKLADAGYETRYRGKTMTLYKLAGWVIAENFADFMIAARWIAAALRALYTSASTPAPDASEAAPSEEPEVLGPEGDPTPTT